MKPYKGYQPLLDSAVRSAFKRVRRFITLEELEAEANYIHVKCRRFYRKEWGAFENYLRFKLRTGLISMARKRIALEYGLKRQSKTPILTRVRLKDRAELPHWSDDLDDREMQVIRIALQRKARRSGDIRKAIVAYLNEIGWSAEAIFSEIRRVLP